MVPLTKEDKILMKTLRLEKGWSVLRMMREFSSRKMKRFPFSAGRSASTLSTPHCRLPALPCARIHCIGKLAAKQSRSKSCGLFSVGGGIATMVYRHKISHWPAEMRANRLLGSTKPGHVKSSDRSAAKKTDDGYQGQGCSCWISCGLTMCVNDRCYFIVCWVKIH